MENLHNRAWRHGTEQARRLLKDTAGYQAQSLAFSLSALGLATVASFMFLDAGFNVQSYDFMDKILHALAVL